MRGTSGPDTRTIPTAPRPVGLAMATMVSGELTGVVYETPHAGTPKALPSPVRAASLATFRRKNDLVNSRWRRG